MKLEFDSIEEVKEFVTKLKGTRGGKATDADDAPAAGTTAPAPAQPPAGGPGPTFSPGPAPGAFGGAPAGGAFPGPAAPTGPSPEVLALVQRISARIDGAIASGQPADAARTWLAGQCGPEAANYTMDQLKTVALPKAAMPVLENIAKLMNA